MAVKSTFNKIGEKVVETFRPTNGVKEMNIVKANEKISELTAKLEAKAPKTFSIADVPEYQHDIRAVEEAIAAKVPKAEVVKPKTKVELADDYHDLPEVTNVTSTVPPYHFIKNGYYLLFDGGKCYFQRARSFKSIVEDGFPVLLVKIYGQEANPNSISTSTWQTVTHITKSEFDKIVASKPTIEELLSAYQRMSQVNNPLEKKYALYMDTTISQPVW